jgi:hypothetical protein
MARTYTNPDVETNNTGIEVTFENGRPKITINAFEDNAKSKSVMARTSNGNYTLWTGEAYDSIGDWTSAQAVARVKELTLEGKKK